MDPQDEQPALQDALDLLHQASRTPAKQRTVRLSSIVDVICQHAFDHGLDSGALMGIVQLASVKTNLDQTSTTTLIKNLYPSQRVSKEAVITVVGALGQGKGKPSPGTQDSLVKWLTNVHEVIEDGNVLSRLYGVLFSMLDSISIRTSLCHLLSLITRRKHVKPFRIQQLLELSRGIGNEPALQGLLRVYKDYYPDIILGSTSTTRKSFAPCPEPEWRTKITAIQESSRTAENSAIDGRNGFKVQRMGRDGGRAPIIPDVHTYHATETSVTLEGIDNVEDFVEKLDRIEPPGQLISYLSDPLLQKYVDLKPSPITLARIDLWLATCLEEQYDAQRYGSGDRQDLSHVLAGLLKNAQFTKTIHPIALAFLKEYLPIWNGQDDTNTLLQLLSYIPFRPFKELYVGYFSAVEQALIIQGPLVQAKLIDFYTSLYQNQASVIPSTVALQGETSQQALKDLVNHVSTLSTSLLLSTPSETNNSLISCILGFYEVVSKSPKTHIIPIILPPMHLVYFLVQDTSLTTISRTCGIIGANKVAFDHHPKPVKNYYPVAVTDAVNFCLRDIYNLFWVARAFTVVEKKSLGLYCDPALRVALSQYMSGLDHEYAIGTAFNFSNNAWLSSVCAAAWRAIEEQQIEKEGYDKSTVQYHQGPVSQRSLEVLKRFGGVAVDWDGAKGYKVFAMNWLAERGLNGIRNFMFATVTDLKGKG